MNNFITIYKPSGKAHTLIHRVKECEWVFSGLIPLPNCNTLQEIEKAHEVYLDEWLQLVPYSTLDKNGLKSYINELEKFMLKKQTDKVELDINWNKNPANIKIQVQYVPDGKYRDHEKKEWIFCPLYRFCPFIQNKFSKYFAYNSEDPMADDRLEFTPEGFSGRQIDIREKDLRRYISELKKEIS